MAIHWFPGHMHKARKEIAKAMSEVDAVIEVLDARLPRSSENPMIRELRGDKPVIKVLSKSDLADVERTQEWLAHLALDPQNHALPMRADRKADIQRLVDLCKRVVSTRVQAGRPVRVMIMGIPNVGKSTLINNLLGRKVAKVGNEPAVTKTQQRFVTHNGLAIFDTPGILWPKIEDLDSTLRLAASGAIKDTVMEYEAVALYVLAFLSKDYPQALSNRYKIGAEVADPDALLAEVGRRRGGLRKGGVVDLHKAAEVVIGDLRTGAFGPVTLEGVAEWVEKAQIQARLAQEAVELAAREAQEKVRIASAEADRIKGRKLRESEKKAQEAIDQQAATDGRNNEVSDDPC